MKAIIFDLDDTLIDTRKRHFILFTEFIKKYELELQLDFASYLKIRKDNNYSNVEILNHFGIPCVLQFSKFWTQYIEAQEFLEYDKLIIQIDLLKELVNLNIKLYILSLRSSPESAHLQLNKLNISTFFSSIVFIPHNSNKNKSMYLKEYGVQFTDLCFVGDSAADYKQALESQTPFHLVKTGLYRTTKTNCKKHNNVNDFILTEYLKDERKR